MRVFPISNNQTSFGSYFPLTEEEIYGYCGKSIGEYINRAMTDLVPIAYTEGAGLDVMVKTIESTDPSKKGITIAIADEKSKISADYIGLGDMKKCPHVKGSVFFNNISKWDMFPKAVCDTAKTLIETFRFCSKNPNRFEYYSKIFK